MRTSERQHARSVWSKAKVEGLGANERGCLDSMIFTLAPGGSSGEQLHTIAHEQFVYVLAAGTVILEINGDVLRLSEGDAITLPRRIPHRFVNRTRQNTKVLLVTARVGY